MLPLGEWKPGRSLFAARARRRQRGGGAAGEREDPGCEHAGRVLRARAGAAGIDAVRRTPP